MLSLDLFDSKYERRLHEGAVDDAEYARLKKLGEKIDYLKQARAKTTDPEMRRAIDGRIKEYDDERHEILSVRGMKEAEQQRAPAKGLLKGKDLITPQQRVAGATPPKPGVAGAVKDVVGGIKRFVKGEPDQGPTYEAYTDPTGQPTARATGNANMGLLIKANSFKQVRPVTFEFPGMPPVPLDAHQTEVISDYYDGLASSGGQNHFIYNVLSNYEEVDRLMTKLGAPLKKQAELLPTEPGSQGQLPLSEKKKSTDRDDIKAGDIKVARELQKLRAQYPAARSDVEAVARAEIDSTERSQRQLAAIRGANEKQDALLKQLVALDREQGQEIDGLDQENDSLEQQLAQVQATNDRLQQTMGQLAGTKVSSRPATINLIPGAPADAPTPQKKPKAQPKIKTEPRISTPKTQEPASKERGPEVFQQMTRTISRPSAVGSLKSLRTQEPANVDQFELTGTEESVTEHGGGIGPRQHWQSLMRNEGWSDKYNPTPYAVYIDGREWKVFSSDEHARAVANKVIANLKRQGRNQKVTIGPSQAWLKGEPVKESNDTKLKLAAEEFIKGIYDRSGPVYKAYYKSFQQGQAVENQLRKQIAKKYGVSEKDLSNAETSHRASKLAGSGRNKDLEETFAMPGTTIPRKSVIQGYTVFFNPETRMVSVTRGGDSEEAAIEQARIGTANIKTFRNAAEKLIDRIEDQIINEGVRDTASATAVIACLLTGGSLTGCATAPQQTTAQQVLKTGQDIGRTVQSAKKITRAGVEAEVQQEIRNVMRGISGRPEELNHSNILRIWKRIKGQPPVPPEPQAPEYGPAEPVRRPATEAKEIVSKEDFVKERDRLLRMINMETDPANKQILKSAIRQLEGRAENEGWISLQQRMIREDNASGAAEEAILKRIFVKHKNLMMEYGPDKITQAAEEVSYNVGDIAHITDEQITEWVGQVEYILGARP